ncbi:hypothetical protein F5148DRAFT_1242137 [Russula earlei]|uniref:Uncharacterized protein n=1 Tax=Russula earlei TaxID=71964 RepID=A0ACC0TWN2_9AGAM|nr:hypothetical protein F5148DRAFT_1242137 [Russula earlei]
MSKSSNWPSHPSILAVLCLSFPASPAPTHPHLSIPPTLILMPAVAATSVAPSLGSTTSLPSFVAASVPPS